MSKPFLGVGLNFPLGIKTADDAGLGAVGELKLAEYEESVRQSILIIIGTAKGERVMRPGFGCGIHDLVFAANTTTTAGQVRYEIEDALIRFEPRIELLGVNVYPGQDRRVLFVSIDYQVRATDNAFNLVYPFYLERGAA